MPIDFPNSPSLNQEYSAGGRTWRWNGSKWIVATSPLSSTTLDDVGDVNAASPSSGDFLKWNGTAWINDPINLGTDTSGNYVSDLVSGTGVSITHTPGEGSSASVAIGQDVGTSASVAFAAVTAPLIGNASTATSLQTARTVSLGGDLSGSASFDGSSDVTITASVSPNSISLGTDTTGNYVADLFAGTGVFVTHVPGEGSSASVAIGQDVSVSASPSFATITLSQAPSASAHAATKDYVDSTVAASSIASLDDIGDVDASSPSDGQFLKYVSASSAWVPAAIPTINALDDVGNVTAPSPASGDFLKWNGSAWVNDAIDLGTDTTGNYVLDLTAGTGVTVTHTPGEGSSPMVAIGQAVSTSSSVTFAAVTAPLVGNASTASALQTARTVSLGGDLSGSASFDGSSDVTITATIQPNSVALGTDTTGNYVSDVVAGTGVTVTHTPGESSSATVAIGQSVATSASVTFAQLTTTGDLTVGGNFTVNGTTTTLNTETLAVEDNFVTLNSNVTGSPTASAGVEVERGTSPNVAIMWNEGTDTWQFTNDGTTYSDLGSGGGLTVSSSAPVGPEEGDLWFDSDTAQTFVYYDSNWVEVGTIAGSAKILVSSTAPASPLEGELWFDSDTGATYVYYSSTWIEIGAAPFDALLNKVDAKGDLLVATSDNTVERLPVGVNGYFLKANSSASAGIEWASIPTINALDDVGDVSASAPTNGYFLQWNGTAWVPAAVATNILNSSTNSALITMDIGG